MIDEDDKYTFEEIAISDDEIVDLVVEWELPVSESTYYVGETIVTERWTVPRIIRVDYEDSYYEVGDTPNSKLERLILSAIKAEVWSYRGHGYVEF